MDMCFIIPLGLFEEVEMVVARRIVGDVQGRRRLDEHRL
jgi:hypothetical protein